ncbi:hypothetical protein K470DRAFT_263223 [Piedraia hortae CBS 480.64]|uniref:Uncharacterized protein n=1 Tax=Piedraia hortae CBS 480.64 TaxID=1314780 RepID=A0A6A7C5X7_9PEZI|nr:hypothetical protein K470DRAFT_263223 [Piedraia hortae CBS 480.64]
MDSTADSTETSSNTSSNQDPGTGVNPDLNALDSSDQPLDEAESSIQAPLPDLSDPSNQTSCQAPLNSLDYNDLLQNPHLCHIVYSLPEIRTIAAKRHLTYLQHIQPWELEPSWLVTAISRESNLGPTNEDPYSISSLSAKFPQ